MHIHHTFVGPDLLKFIALADDIAEVDQKDFIARAQVANDIGDRVERTFDALGHAAQAEVEAVVGTGTHLAESIKY